jgi:hypothetical protein
MSKAFDWILKTTAIGACFLGGVLAAGTIGCTCYRHWSQLAAIALVPGLSFILGIIGRFIYRLWRK